MEPVQPIPSTRWLSAALGLLVAGLFVAITTIHLTAQGLQYDEMHQAPAAFAYVGRDPTFVVALKLGTIPLLNMTYSGAVKPALYGAYLRVSGAGFSVRSWRLLGILLVAVGIGLFFLLGISRLPLLAQLAFALLFLTDTSLVLLVRYDYGPVALAMLLRLCFLAAWIRGEMSGPPSPLNTFAMTALVSFGVFEKLSGVVLAGPLFLALISMNRRTMTHWYAAFAGGLLGASPLLLVNAVSWLQTGDFVSLRGITSDSHVLLGGGGGLLRQYAALGYGTQVIKFILGEPHQVASGLENFLRTADLYLFVSALLLAVAVALRTHRREPTCRLAGLMLAGYGLVALGLVFLPRHTWAHHWLLGTPFQYLGIALVLAGAWRQADLSGLLTKALSVVVGLLLALRILRLAWVIGLLLQDSSSPHWDPSSTRIGQFAVQEAEQASFVAADWGIAVQIYCVSNGLPGLVYEPFWNYSGPTYFEKFARTTGKNTIYLIERLYRPPINPKNTARLVQDLSQSALWQEVPVEPMFRELRVLRVRKFVAVSP